MLAMASPSTRSILLAAALLLLLIVAPTCCDPGDFQPESGIALASWAGAPDGAGSEAGECGYLGAVKDTPWSSNVTAVSPEMFRGGAACGTCWEINVKEDSYDPDPVTVRVVVSDVCRGGPCAAANGTYFELSGHAFSAIKDLKAGRILVRYTRVDCSYYRLPSYRVDGSATTANFILTPLFLPGYETINLTLGQYPSPLGSGLPMTRLRGAVYQADATSLQGPPYSVYVHFNDTTKTPGRMETLSLANSGYIPPGWEPGQTYGTPGIPPSQRLP